MYKKNISNKHVKFSTVTFLILFLIFSLRLLVTDHIPINWDAPIIFDGSYRVLMGQLPHVDFSTPVGSFLFFFGALGMKLSTVSIFGLNFGIILLDCLLLLLFAFLIRNFTLKNLHVIFLGSLLFTPRMLSYGTFDFGYTGYYNIIGYSIIYILFFLQVNEIKLSNDVKNSKHSILTFVSALLVVSLFFLKITFFFASILLIFIHLLLCKHKIKYFLSLLLYLSLFFFLAFLLLDFNLSAVFRDLIIVYKSRSSTDALSFGSFEKIFTKNILDYLVILFLIYVKSRTLPLFKKEIIYYGIAFLFLGLFLSVSIMQPPENLFSSFFAMMIFSYHHDVKISSLKANYFKEAIVYFKQHKITVFFISKFIILNLFGLMFIALFYHKGKILKYITPKTQDERIIILTNSLSLPKFNQNESNLLVKTFISPFIMKSFNKNDGIITVGKNNMYNFYYKSMPKSNQLLYWHYGVTFNEKISEIDYYHTNSIFKNIKYIEFDFKNVHSETCYKFLKIYGAYISKNFKLIHSDNSIKIYEKI